MVATMNISTTTATATITTTAVNLNFAEHLNRLPILIFVIMIGVSVSSFNILTISIILRSKKLRRPYNYPIINILLAATLQSFFTVPAYAFKRLDKHIPHHREVWICNIYRFPYFFCGDILRLSFMLVSFDRVFAVKCVYFYKDCITRNIYIVVILLIWVVVSIVDVLPFFPLGKPLDGEQCSYVTGHMWGICVTVAFNVVPFVITIVNFFVLWRIASKITVKAHSIRKELSKNDELELLGDERGTLEDLSKYTLKKVMDVEISTSRFDAKGHNVFNRKTSYMYAMRNTNDFDVNIPEVEIDLDHHPSLSLPSVDATCTSCSLLSEKLLLILEMRATKTSVLLLMVYMVCWTPLAVYQFIENICASWISGIKHEHAFIDQFVLKVLSLFSSVFLPLVYCWKTKLFRKEAQRLSTRIRAQVKDIPLKYKERFYN